MSTLLHYFQYIVITTKCPLLPVHMARHSTFILYGKLLDSLNNDGHFYFMTSFKTTLIAE